MSVHSIDGQTFGRDGMVQRISAGTVGDEHIAKRSISPQSINQELSVTDPRILYNGGTGSGTWTISIPTAWKYRHSRVATCNTPGAQFVVNFSGTKISVIGPLRSDAGKFDVYIDGLLYLGKTYYVGYIPVTLPAGQQAAPTSSQVGVLSATATSIACDAASFSGFPTSGYIKIDQELIAYSSVDAVNHYFTGCTRGANATIHNVGATIYNVASTVDPYISINEYRHTLWTADDIPPGDHQLVLQIRSDKNASSSDTAMYIESVVIGGLLGGSAINTELRTVSLGTVTTNGSGYATATISLTREFDQMISILGVVDDAHVLSHQVDQDGVVYLHGANSTAYNNVKLTYVVIGTSI